MRQQMMSAALLCLIALALVGPAVAASAYGGSSSSGSNTYSTTWERFDITKGGSYIAYGQASDIVSYPYYPGGVPPENYDLLTNSTYAIDVQNKQLYVNIGNAGHVWTTNNGTWIYFPGGDACFHVDYTYSDAVRQHGEARHVWSGRDANGNDVNYYHGYVYCQASCSSVQSVGIFQRGDGLLASQSYDAALQVAPGLTWVTPGTYWFNRYTRGPFNLMRKFPMPHACKARNLMSYCDIFYPAPVYPPKNRGFPCAMSPGAF